jgi:hypothetical protein
MSWAWPKTRTTTQVAIAISRLPTKLRFPQGSEVWITGCPKFVTAAKSGLINPELKAETELPELLPWRLVSDFPRNWGFDRLLSTSPFGFIVFLLLGFVAGVVNVVRTAGAGPGRR